MNYTMKEIAKLAGVSQPTVSRVINGNPNVNPDIRKKVLQVIESVGYKPNKAAQTLKNQNSNIIGVNVTSISNPYFMDLIEALEKEARKKGYNILLHNCENNLMIEKENYNNFIARQVDGAIVVPEANDNLAILSQSNVPTVVVTQDNKAFNSISISHEKGGAIAAEYLINNGIHRYLYVGQGERDKDRKLIGYLNELYESGIEFRDEDYIHDVSETNNSLSLNKKILDYIETHALTPSTGILCGNDIIALQFINACSQKGLHIHQDYKIIGFDDTLLAKSYGFSSIRQPVRQMATHSIEMLVDVMNGRISEVHQTVLDPILITREHIK